MELTGLEALELRYDKGGTFFDGTPVNGTTLADLDDDLIAAFLKPLGSPSRATDALVSRGLVTISREATSRPWPASSR